LSKNHKFLELDLRVKEFSGIVQFQFIAATFCAHYFVLVI